MDIYDCVLARPPHARPRAAAQKRGPSLATPPPVHIEAMLFDIDGTLVDSNDKHADCWIEAFAHFDKKVEWDTVRWQIGKGGDLLVPDTLSAREMRRFGEEVKKVRGELWKEKYMPAVRPFDGIRDALAEVKERGIRLALASSSNPDEVEYYVELLGVGEMIEGSTSKEDARFSKPSPEIFQAALERTRSDAARTLAVGDTPYDILSAHRIPLPVAALLCGGFPRETLAKAEFLYPGVTDLVRNLDGIDDYFAHD